MTERTVNYDLRDEEEARSGWYLKTRDQHVVQLAQRAARMSPGEVTTVLDAGCGTGGAASLLQAVGFAVTGVDRDEPSLEWGKSQGRLTDYQCADISAMPFEDNAFGLCVCAEVLEHLEDDVAALRELLRVSEGPVLVTVPAHMYLWTDSDRLLMHHRRYSRKDLMTLVEKSGGHLDWIAPSGVIPGLAVLLYKAFSSKKKTVEQTEEGEDDLPLASRFSIPPVLNALLEAMSRTELWMSRHRLIPWGHAWGLVVRKEK